MGNRISEKDSKGAKQYQYDKFGRLIDAGDVKYGWDINGNMISETAGGEQIKFSYNDRGLPSLLSGPMGVIRYDWDGDGNMTARRTGRDVTYCLPNFLTPENCLQLEFDKTGKPAASYIYGDVLLGRKDEEGRTRFFLEDGFGSIRYIMDLSGRVLGERDYTPFAEPVTVKGETALAFRIMEECFLPQFKKYLIGNRLYDPKSGRYLSPDPEPGYLERFDSFNRYTHGSPNPSDFMAPRCFQTYNPNDFLKKLNQGSYFGTRYGEEAARYWADRQVATGNPLYTVPGVMASLWTPDTWQQTALTLSSPALGKMIGGAWESATIRGTLAGSSREPFHLDLADKFIHYGISKWGPHIGLGLGAKASFHLYPDHINIGGFRGIDLAVDWGLVTVGASQLLSKVSLEDPFRAAEENLGGIKLSATGEFIGKLGNISGAVYDREKQLLILISDKNLAITSIKAEDLAIALTLVFGRTPQDPQFSLDPADPKNPRGKWLKAVYLPKEILAGTEFGKALFEADWLLKQYSFGVEIDDEQKAQDWVSSVAGFKSTADLSFEQRDNNYGKESWARFWIVSDIMKLRQSGDSIYFAEAKMRVKAKKQVPDQSANRVKRCRD